MKKRRFIIILGSTALLCSLFLLRNPILAALRTEPMPRLKAVTIAEPFVLNACGGGSPAMPDQLLKLSMAGRCAYSASRSAVVASEFYQGPVGPVPALVIRPRNHSISSAPLVIVDLVGGPRGVVFDSLKASQILRYYVRQASQNGVMTVTPGYLGTSTRTLHPASDFDLASEEIARLIEHVRNQRPSSPVCIVGGSLGGYLAAALLPKFPSVPMLALNPQLETPREVWRRAMQNPGLRLAYGAVRRHSLSGGRAIFEKEEMALLSDIQERFFGQHQEQSLADLLEGQGRNMTLAYSPADDRIGVWHVPEVARRSPGVRIVKTRPVGHNLSRVENFWAFRPVLDDFIRECLERRR